MYVTDSIRHSHEYCTEFDYKLHVLASPRIFLIWKQHGEEVEKALCLVNDEFQDHGRVTNSLRNVHCDVPADMQIVSVGA
jgi:hypothetical protein